MLEEFLMDCLGIILMLTQGAIWSYGLLLIFFGAVVIFNCFERILNDDY